ncbi:hypothetical protein Hanom_Chr02g00150891 [Helianthus anomalus]
MIAPLLEFVKRVGIRVFGSEKLEEKHIVVKRGKNVILHSHSEMQPNNTLLIQHLLVQSLLTIQTSYLFSTY